MSDPTTDDARLLLVKVREARAAVFEVEQMLVPKDKHPQWLNAFGARCSLGDVEDYALRQLGIRGG